MITYKIQFKYNNPFENLNIVWQNLKNKIDEDFELITLVDARTIADTYSNYHPDYLNDTDFRIVSSKGEYLSIE